MKTGSKDDLLTREEGRQGTAVKSKGRSSNAKADGRPKNGGRPAHGLPIYHTEEMLWTNQKLYPRAGTYHVPFALRVMGEVDLASANRALAGMCDRHVVLRTTFPTRHGLPVRVVHKDLSVALKIVTAMDAATRTELILTHCQEPFDLETGPLWRAVLIKGGGADPIILFVVHHIVFDERSIGIFVEDFVSQYDAARRGKPVDGAAPQFLDYINEKTKRITNQERTKNNEYWVGKISGMERLIELPFYRCPNDERRFRGGSLRTTLGQGVVDRLSSFCAQNRLERGPVMVASFVALLYRYFGSTDNTVLSLIDDRAATGFDRVIGFAGNVLPVRTVLGGGETFNQLARLVTRLTDEAFQHREIPLNDIVQIVRGEEGHVTEAPFHVMFEERERPKTFQASDGVRFTQEFVDNGLAKMPFSLTATPVDRGLELTWEFNKHVFDAITIGEFADQYSILLKQLCDRPNDTLESFDLAIPPRAVGSNRPVHSPNSFERLPKELVEQSLIDRFEYQVAKFGTKAAVCTKDKSYTYQALSIASHQLAQRLAARFGNGPRRYALCFEHNASFIAALLGVLKSVGAYVPLDLTFPKDRLLYVLKDAGVDAVIGNGATAELCQELSSRSGVPFVDLDEVEREERHLAPLPARPGKLDLAYILYTSGSTGKPKGVPQIHRNVLHHVRMWTNSLCITEHDRHTLFSAYPWDSAVQDVFGALLNGATLYPLNIRESGLKDLPAWIRENGITIVHTTIPLFRRIMKSIGEREVLSNVRAIAAGGDAMHKADLELFKKHFPPESSLVNMYGATESSSGLYFVAGHDTVINGEVVPLGFPAEEGTVVLVRNGVEQRAHSIVGEICIKSEFVSPGYWNAESETRARFRPDPASANKRVFMTGDLGRVLHDGSIEYVGRTDFQVKIRGFRVGLGEVEAVIAEHPSVKDVVVIADEDVGEEKELVVYYALHETKEKPTSKDLREYMLARVPDYMVPRYFVDVGALPLTSRGKIDRNALPKPKPEVQDTASSSYLKARTPIEDALTTIWEEVLQVKPVGIRDNFFMLGGHSMLGFEMFDRVKERFGLEMPPVTLYRGAATVELLALAIEKQLGAQPANA